jgi:hypothetical protein
MLRKDAQAKELRDAIRDVEARVHTKTEPKEEKPAKGVGTFGAKLIACETLADVKRLLGIP